MIDSRKEWNIIGSNSNFPPLNKKVIAVIDEDKYNDEQKREPWIATLMLHKDDTFHGVLYWQVLEPFEENSLSQGYTVVAWRLADNEKMR